MANPTNVRVRTRSAQKTEGRYRIFGPDTNVVEDVHVRTLKEYSGRRQVEDPFKDEYGLSGSIHHVLEPTYNFYALMRLPDENSMLRQCIDAMVTNVDGHGHQLEYIGPEGQEESEPAKAEKRRMEELLDFPNDEYTLQELRDRFRRDLETLGNAYLEVGYGKDGSVVMLSHIPAHTMRMTKREDQAVAVEVTLPRGGTVIKQTVRKRFRRYVQMVGVQRVYFKEFGDPRTIDPSTGFVNDRLRPEESATSIIHISLYQPGSPYGLPRWFNQMPAIVGSRQAELTNLDFFKDNAIPAMAILVSGGSLTSDTINTIEDHFNAVRGRQASNRLLVIEATGDEEASSENGQISPPRLELKPLAGERQNDGLFQEYEKNNRDKIRSSFRLPPLFVGLSEDMTYATAKTAYEVAESQVFAPERQRFDDMVNLKLLASFNPQYWRFRSNPPKMSDPQDLMQAIDRFSNVGALTPNLAIQMANQFFDMEIKPVEEEWGDYPYDLVKALITADRLRLKIEPEKQDPPPQLQPGQLPPPNTDDAVDDGDGPDDEEDPDDADEDQRVRAAPEAAVIDTLLQLRRIVKQAQVA